MSEPVMPRVSRRLMQVLVDTYPDYVWRRLPERPDAIETAVERGREWLESTLADLLGRPFDEQRRGPLEVFQEAMRFPTEHLLAAGVEPAARDPVMESALPGDLYRLAPASTRELGEDVWQLHMRWGATKAGVITGSAPRGWGDGER